MEKTIKYLENGEYHYATVRSVGDLAQLKTDSKETLVEAINELWNGGGNADPSKAPKPEGYDQLVQDVADAVKNQQEISQQWIEWQNEEAQLTEERKQAYLQAMKEMQEAIDKAKADAAALDDKTTKLDEQITKTFSDLDASIQNMHEQLQKEADRMNQELIDTKSDLTKVRTDLQNAQLDNGRIHDELTNINGKFEHKVWQTDLDPLKAQIDRAETSVQQTKDELLGKASREDLDTVTNAVSKLDTQLKETAKGVEISVKKDELGGDVARLLNDKTNLLLGTRNFAGDKWSNLDHWHEEPGYWNGLKVYSSTSDWYGIQYQYEVKKGNQYTFSFYARQQSENNSAYIMLSEGSTGSQRACTEPYQKSDTHIGTEWKRYSLTFQAIADGTIYPRVEQSVTNNTIYVAGYKLELGKNATPWEPNEADIAENIEHTESQFNVYSDQIAGIVKKQEKMGDTERQLDTRITETAEGLKQTSKDLQDANGKITEFKGQLESTAHGLKTEYEKYTNDAIGQISDSTLNLIRNSSFQNKDEDFDQWQNISAKANVRSDENGLRWVELTQSGLTTNNPEGITSNYFNIKQGKVTVAVDIKSGDKANLDNESILFLELYNDAKKRVDFKYVTLSELGLSKNLLGDHKVHRGLYRLGIDRNDAKYMTVKAHLMRNGDLYFTNFSARLSSIDDGAYEPNPDDINQQILKQNTKIEQNAKEVAIKANSVDVTRDIKSAVDGIQVGGTNLIKNSGIDIVVESKTTDAWPAWKYKVVYYDLTPGETYTFSVSATNTNNVKDASIRIFNEAQNKEAPGNLVFPADGKRHSTTFTLPKDEVNYSVYLYAGHMGNIEGKDFVTTYHHPQLELGNKSTSWSPAPEDTSAEIKSAKDAAIKVASDQINIHVNELSTQFDDKLNKRINEQKTASEKFTSDGIEQVVTKITNVKGDVDRLGDTVNGVGSRNLLHNTSDQYRTLTGSDWFAKSTANDIYTSVANYHGGNQFTYAATITNPSNYPVRLVIYCYDKSKSKKLKTILGAPVSANQPNARVNVTTVMDTDTWWIRTNIETLQGNTPQISIQVKDERLVEGTVSSSWSPNPDDINQQIANTNKKIDTQTLDSANIDEMKTQGHYFVRNLTGNPIGGWVYVDVTGNNNDRIRQDVYADQNNQHKYRSWNGSRWSGWEQGAYISDVNNVKTEVTASVKNLGDRVTTQVNSVETKVDGIQIGGRNLAVGTDKDIVIDDTNNKGTQGWQFVTIHLAEQPKLGDQITISAEGVLTGNGHLDDYTVILYNETTTDARSVQGRLKPGQRSSATVKVDNINGVGNTVLLIYAGNPSDTQGKKNVIHHLKIEKGNKPTEWSLAPEDTLEAIKEVNTKWDVANGQIQGKVTETQVNNILNGKGYATQSWAQTQFQMRSDAITLQAVRDNITNGIQNQLNSTNDRINDTNNRLNNLKIGGTNLLRGTSDTPRRLQGSGYLCKTTASDIYTSTADFHGGDQFTYSATITNNSNHPVSLEMWLFNGREKGHTASNINSHSEIVPAHTQNKRVSATITITSDTWWVRTYVIYSDGHGVDGETVDVSNEKLEVGNVATDWSPNPNDTGNGVNVLRGTADFSWPTGIGTNGTVNLGYEKFDATTIQLHVWGNNGGIYTKWGEAFPDGQIQVGEQYVFSFDIKGNGTFSSVKNESESLNIASGVPVTNTYQRVKVVGTIKSLDKAFIIYFQGDYDVRIKNVKIERGSKATPWTPHPFDDKDKGVNLLKSTAYWNPNDWNHISDNVWYDDSWVDSKGHKAYGHHTAWQGLGQTVYVTPGVYTWSAQIYLNGLDSNDSVYPYMGDSQYNGTAQVQEIRRPMLGVNDQNRWIDYSTTFYVKNAGNLCVRPELNRDHGTIHVGSQKLEHGMVATPWTPSPYDDKTATITLDSADINSMKTQGHYFVRNLANNPIGGWVYVDVTGNNNDRLKQEVYQDNGYEHRSRRWTGSGWTEWTTDVNNKNVVSQINITPDQIKIASNKIVIDGNTDIHGDLRTDRVRLVGKNGAIDMTGDTGIKLTNNDGSSMLLGRGNIDLMYKNDFRMNIDSSLMTIMQRNQFTTQKNPIAILNIGSSWNHSNNQIRGADIRYNPGNVNDVNLHGADYLALSYNKPNLTPGEANIKPQLVMAYQDLKFDENHYLWRKGVNVADDLTIQEYQRINVGYRDKEDQSGKWTNDPLMIHRMQWSNSYQADRYQPTIRLGYSKDSMGHAGVTFLWDQVKPFGDRDISDLGSIWFNGQRFVFGWASHKRMFGNQQQPAFMRLDDKGEIMSGIAFTPGSTWDLGSGAWNITASVMNNGG
ncbi:phage head spike fiber domain-containing protein [Limosilactobacillus reuteri]|uniref:phage head spike fiber domain-containing protein n=1 Tax=Limosilactobacillus reuteri TaxID=1598 RepID=UPI0015C45E39|nr:phage specificity protein [Limosilactobacillus reuteri]